MNQDQKETIVSIRVKEYVKDLIDQDRAKYSMPRSSWITQAIVERLERLGYEVNR